MDGALVASWHERPDIVGRVFSFLTTTKDVLVCEAVSRTWRDARIALPSVVHLSGSIQGAQLKWATANVDRISTMKLYLTDHTSQGQRHELVRLMNRARALKQLDISDGSALALMDNFGHLSSLQHLTIQNCPNIKALPATLGCLQRLQYLKVHNCRNLKVLWVPTDHSQPLGHLPSLQQLSVSRCRTLQRIPDLGPLSNVLQQLTILECSDLAQLPEGLSQLTRLQVST